MTLPSDYQRQQRKEPDPPTAPAEDTRLDQPREDNGSWMVGNTDDRTTTEFIKVEAPRQPPELHPDAAASLLKLLRRVNDHRTDNSIEENG